MVTFGEAIWLSSLDVWRGSDGEMVDVLTGFLDGENALVEPFGFGGWNESRFGVGDITGPSSIEFWTQSKKTTVRW